MADDTTGWFTCDISRKDLKAVMKRNDRTAALWFGGWAVSLLATGVLAYLSLGTWWVVPAFLLYGWVYCFAEAIAHECSHGTPFRTRWLNEAVHFITGMIVLKEPTYHRYMHARHHTHTIFVGQDPEIQLPRPTNFLHLALELFRLPHAAGFVTAALRHSVGSLSEQTRAWVPESEHKHLIWGARAQVALVLAIAVACVVYGTWLPLLFVGLPRIYGATLQTLCSFTQHAGLEQDVKDHRLNTRTVCMNPILRFLYCNMNYHIEHHIYPLVPFYALPRLHGMIKSQLPQPYHGMLPVLREMIVTFIRQQREPDYCMRPRLPEEAAGTAPV